MAPSAFHRQPSAPHPQPGHPVRPSAVLGRVLCWHLAAVVLLSSWATRLVTPSPGRRSGERGDVPGWVLITLMTAGLVTMLWALAGEQLRDVFTRAISSVTGPTR